MISMLSEDKKQKINLGKTLLKLMNDSVFGKTKKIWGKIKL